MTSPHPSQRARVAILLALSLTLTGCSSLPTEGIPHAFDIDVPSPSTVNFVAGAPTQGTSPEALVEGFLRACSAGTSDDFETARLFLTRNAAKNWKPDVAIQVYATDATPLISLDPEAKDPTVVMDVPTVATVDERGNLTESQAGHALQMRYRVVKEEGEWRIDTPDDGIIISAASFNASYQFSRIFFPMRSAETMASEARWFPRKRLARHLMEALLAGPSEHLAPAVESAIPDGTRLPADGVDVSDGAASITLDTQLPDSAETQKLLAWQIFQTLRQSAQVSDVSISIGGDILDTSELPVGPKYRLDTAITNGEDEVGMLTNGEYSALPIYQANADGTPNVANGPAEQWDNGIKPDARSKIAMSPTNPAIISWTTGSQLYTVDRATKRTQHVDVHQGSWPSVDRFSWTWTVDSKGAIIVLNPSGRSSALDTDNSVDGLTSLRVSPDGSRVAMIRRIGNQYSVWTATIERSADGTPRNITAINALPRLSADIRDISWASSGILVALQGNTDDNLTVVSVPLGGFTQTVPAPAGARYLTAGSGPHNIYIMDDKGNIWLRSNAIWQPVEADISTLRFPG